MWYYGLIICAAATSTCNIQTSPGVETFDKCLNVQAVMNQKFIGAQILSRLYLSDGSGHHLNFGCFEYEVIGYDETKEVDKKLVELETWHRFSPQARPKPDKNIKRILKREFYDYPRPPWQQVPGKLVR